MQTLTDIASGAIAKSVSFGTKRQGNNSRPPGYHANRLLGVFAFRFAFFDPMTSRWVSGPWSENVYVRPKGYPVGVNPGFPGSFPATDVALPDRPTFRALACTVGGRVR